MKRDELYFFEGAPYPSEEWPQSTMQPFSMWHRRDFEIHTKKQPVPSWLKTSLDVEDLLRSRETDMSKAVEGFHFDTKNQSKHGLLGLALQRLRSELLLPVTHKLLNFQRSEAVKIGAANRVEQRMVGRFEEGHL